MKYILYPPKHIDAEIDLPASKSISNRALIISALAGEKVNLLNPSPCDDTAVISHALQKLPPVIDIHGAGTAMRFLTAYLSVTPGEHTLTGSERMKHRPIGPLVDALRYLGADISYLAEEGYPPLLIKGKKLEGGDLEIAGDISSQYISALLLIAPTLSRGLNLRLRGEIVSRPYIDLTMHVMHEFGSKAEWSDVSTIHVPHDSYRGLNYRIEGDWSASSYWYEVLALSKDTEWKLSLQGLHDASRQGDSVVRYIFSLLGVKTAFSTLPENGRTTALLTRHRRSLPRLDYNFINSPDVAQTLVCTCLACEIPFHFTGLGSLRIKETDRIRALEREAAKLGYVIFSNGGNELMWDGSRTEPTMEPILTYEDHRMAMSFAPMCLKFPGLTISEPRVVEKSYPAFWDDLRKAGFRINEERD